MAKIRVTLKDIAEATGFTINTVSRALHNKEDISIATKQVVRKTAEKMGYVAHQFAASLRSGKSKTIAVILGDIANPFFAKQIKEIEYELYQNFYNTIIFNTDESTEKERTAVLAAISKNVDGIIICPTYKGESNIDLIIKAGLPYVLLGRYFQDRNDNYCVLDDKKGSYLATGHLLKLGHKDILYLGVENDVSSSIEREAGYREALQSFHLTKHEVIRNADFTLGSCRNAILQLLNQGVHFTGLVAFSDMIALEAIYALNEAGKSVPNDVSVVGFDNIQEHYFLPPALDTIGQFDSSMTKCACEFLLSAIEDSENRTISKTLDVNLFVRGSCKNI